MAYRVADGLQTRNARCASAVQPLEETVDELHRSLYVAILAPESDWPVETAIDLTLIGRYYERYSDHAMSVATRLAFAITGEPELWHHAPKART
jgi:phosphate transport system protein